MTLTKSVYNPSIVKITAQKLTEAETDRIAAGDCPEGCSHITEYKTGNYKKRRYGFFYVLDEEWYCPHCDLLRYKRSYGLS